jgi:hypothetical protein
MRKRAKKNLHYIKPEMNAKFYQQKFRAQKYVSEIFFIKFI